MERPFMKVRSSNRKNVKWLTLTVSVIFLWIPALFGAQTLPLTPGEVVQLWLTVYPDNLDRARYFLGDPCGG